MTGIQQKEVDLKRTPHYFKPFFISIKFKMLITFIIAFFVFSIIFGVWFFFSLNFISTRVQTTQEELIQIIRNDIDPEDIAVLYRKGQVDPEGYLTDTRYLKLMDWLDSIHQIRPTAWPYIFVPGKSPNQIIYIADIQNRYSPEKAKSPMQSAIMDTQEDTLLSNDVFIHVDENGISNLFKSLDGNLNNENKPNLKKFASSFSQQMVTYGYIRDNQGNPVIGIGMVDENIYIKNMNSQIGLFLFLSFLGTCLMMFFIAIRTGHVITNPVVNLTQAAELINAGDNEKGLRLLQKNQLKKVTIDEIGRLGGTIRTLVSMQNALYTISASASTTTDINGLIELIYKEVSGLIPADTFIIALYNEATKQIKVISPTCHLGQNFMFATQEYIIQDPPDMIGYVIQTRQPQMLTANGVKKLIEAGIINNDNPPVNWLGVPIQDANEKTFGVLATQSFAKRAAFTSNDKSLLVFIASQLSMILKRSQTENELRQSHQLLEQRVQNRTADLQDANQKLKNEISERKRAEKEMQSAKEAAVAANIAKSVFLANMSHELRTPLNAILGFSNLMAHDPNFPAQQKEDLGIILQSGEHLLDLINDVLEMSKIESGRMVINPTSFDLHQLLKEVEEVFRVRAVEKGLSLIHEKSDDLPCYIHTDENKLRQILFNLLSNGVKFTQHGGLILRSRLVDSPLPENKVRLGFEVEDSGPGIPADQIKDLFDYFVQTDAGKKSLEGTGLGLSISKNLIKMLDGEIQVISEVGKGSVFSFEITVEKAKKEDIKVKPRERRAIGIKPGRSWRILITEDREANRKLLVKLLSPFSVRDGKNGFEIREAVNGLEALNICQTWMPDLIFMDMRMPEMDGHEATRAIRLLPESEQTKIIALTASAFEEERQVILSEGIDDFIRKPFKEYEIFNVLSKHLNGVDFIYSDEEALQPTRPVSLDQQTDLAFLAMDQISEEWLSSFKFAVESADSEAIHLLLQEVKKTHPRLIRPIEGLVNQYRFDLILKIIEKKQQG